MANVDLPGWTGAQLMRAALDAIDRRPDLADAIRAELKKVSDGGHTDGLHPDVLAFLGLIEQAGIPIPKLLPRKPR